MGRIGRRWEKVMSTHWYVLRSQPHKENALYQQLLTRDHEAFFPALHVKPVNPRSAKIRPYFPGYLFVHADLEELGYFAFDRIPFAIGLVRFGETAPPVPDALVNAIQQRLEKLNMSGIDMEKKFKAGSQIRIQGGPFKGYDGIFDTHLPGRERVRILLQLLDDHKVPLELPPDQIILIESEPETD
jgi:transcription antitermination factor NusG